MQGTRCLLRALAQAQMALGTLAETKVPRLPGRDPANTLSPVGDPKEEKLTSLAGDQNANAESLQLRFGKRVLEAIIGAVEHGLPEHFHGIGRSSL